MFYSETNAFSEIVSFIFPADKSIELNGWSIAQRFEPCQAFVEFVLAPLDTVKFVFRASPLMVLAEKTQVGKIIAKRFYDTVV